MRRVIEPLLLEVDVSAVLLLEAEAHGRRANLDADGSDLRDHLLHVLPVPQLVPDGPLPVHVAADGGDMLGKRWTEQVQWAFRNSLQHGILHDD